MRIKALVQVVMTVDVDGDIDEPENMLITDYFDPDMNDVFEAEVIEVIEKLEDQRYGRIAFIT